MLRREHAFRTLSRVGGRGGMGVVVCPLVLSGGRGMLFAAAVLVACLLRLLLKRQETSFAKEKNVVSLVSFPWRGGLLGPV